MTLNAAPAAVTLNAAPAVTLPAAPATPAVTLPGAVPAAAAPNQADLNAQLAGLAALVPQLKGLSALSTSQSPAGLASLDAINGASLNLLNKVRTNRLQNIKIRIYCTHKCRALSNPSCTVSFSFRSLSFKVPLEAIPLNLRGDIEVLIAATQQLGALGEARKPLERSELAKVVAASNNLLQSLPQQAAPVAVAPAPAAIALA